MGEEDFMKIHAALFATATDDEGDVAKDDDDAEIYTHDDEDYYDEDEYEDDHEYDDWIENTYYLGEEEDEYQSIKKLYTLMDDLRDKLDCALDYMNNDEHRYYSEEYNALVSATENLESLIDEDKLRRYCSKIKSIASDYSTW